MTAPETTTAVDVIEDMIDNPARYGFEWGWGHLQSKGVQVTRGRGAPYIKHIDAALISKTFGLSYLLDVANGQSARVRDQTIRDELKDDQKLRGNERAMQRWILQKALGRMPRRRAAPVFTAVNGQSFGSQIEADQISIAFLVDIGLTVEEAKQKLAEARKA